MDAWVESKSLGIDYGPKIDVLRNMGFLSWKVRMLVMKST